MTRDDEETVRLLVMEHRDEPGWSVMRFGALMRQEVPGLRGADLTNCWQMYGASNHTHDPATGRRLTPEQIAERNYGARSQR